MKKRKMKYRELFEKIRNKDVDDIMDDLQSLAIGLDTDVDDLFRFRYGWSMAALATSLSYAFPDKYQPFSY